MVFPDDAVASEFLRLLRDPQASLPPGVAKRWEALLIDFRKGSRMWPARPPLAPGLRQTPEFAALGQSWGGSVDVVVVDEATGSILGIPEDQGWLVDQRSGLEVAYPDAIHACDHISRIGQFQSEGNLPVGASREVFWDEVIMPIWRSAKRATLVDRYLLQGLWRGRKGEHVEWLLGRLADAPGARGSVTLITEAKDPWLSDPEAVLDQLEPFCAGGRIDRLQLHLVPARERGSHLPHDRHIRFDTNAVILHAGFDRLSRANVGDPNGMNWEYRWAEDALSSLRAAEERAVGAHRVRGSERTF